MSEESRVVSRQRITPAHRRAHGDEGAWRKAVERSHFEYVTEMRNASEDVELTFTLQLEVSP